MPKRPYCEDCGYPVAVCLCADVHVQHNATRVWILQHPSEVSAAKNTARLLALGLSNCTTLVGETPTDFTEISQAIRRAPQGWALLYPGEDSLPLEDYPSRATIGNLLVLDGTWKKAFKLFKLNPWLARLPRFHFAKPPQGRYRIRKTKVEDGLSTLEAVAWGLHLIDGTPPEPLWLLLEARMARLSPHGQ